LKGRFQKGKKFEKLEKNLKCFAVHINNEALENSLFFSTKRMYMNSEIRLIVRVMSLVRLFLNWHEKRLLRCQHFERSKKKKDLRPKLLIWWGSISSINLII